LRPELELEEPEFKLNVLLFGLVFVAVLVATAVSEFEFKLELILDIVSVFVVESASALNSTPERRGTLAAVWVAEHHPIVQA